MILAGEYSPWLYKCLVFRGFKSHDIKDLTDVNRTRFFLLLVACVLQVGCLLDLNP